MELPRRYKDIFNRYVSEIKKVEKIIKGFDSKKEKLIKNEVYATEFEINEIEMQWKLYEDEMEKDMENFRESEFYTEEQYEPENKTDYSDIENLIEDDYGLDEEDINKAFELLNDNEDSFEDDVNISGDIKYNEEMFDDDILEAMRESADGNIEYDDDYYFEDEREYGMDMEIDVSMPNVESKNVKPVDRIYKFTNGDIYIGKMINNRMQGVGNYIFHSDREVKNEYIGEFRNGLRYGKGIYMFSNGDEYIGNFRNEMANGIGRMLYKNGAEYIGEWTNSRKNGYGFYQWETGEVYIGEFKRGKFNGRGICYASDGQIMYDGTWKNNQIHGKGRFFWGDGRRYEGDFIEGRKHGEGTFYFEDDVIYEGTWENDEPIIFGMKFDEIFKEK